MLKQAIVRLNALVTVNPRDWELFKEMVSETKSIVAKEGPDSVLTHECYCDPVTHQCLIVEAYAHEEALLNHLQLIAPLSEQYKPDWEIIRLELMGPYSDVVVQALSQGLKQDAFHHYGTVLAHL